ncbi:MAG: DinB family protein [Spirosomataceae bacterium]
MNIASARQDLLAQLLHIRQTVEYTLQPLSEAQIQWKPAPDKWSVLECLVHLNMANQYYAHQLKFKLEHTVARQNLPTDFEMSFNGKVMLSFVDPKSTRKIPAPAMFKPKTHHLDTDKVLKRYFDILENLEDTLRKSDQIDWNLPVISPFTSWIKFRLGDVLIFVTAHQQRHLNQALRVLEQPAFPKQ